MAPQLMGDHIYIPVPAPSSMLNPSACHHLARLALDTTGLRVQMSAHKIKIELQQCGISVL